MPYDFRSDRYSQTQRDNALIAPTVRHSATLPPDYRGVLLVDCRVDDLTALKAGEACEVTGEHVRFWGGHLVCRSVLVDGVRVPAVSVVERIPVVDKGE